MVITDSFRRSLKRKNYSSQTVKTYMHIVTHFIQWLAVPLALPFLQFLINVSQHANNYNQILIKWYHFINIR